MIVGLWDDMMGFDCGLEVYDQSVIFFCECGDVRVSISQAYMTIIGSLCGLLMLGMKRKLYGRGYHRLYIRVGIYSHVVHLKSRTYRAWPRLPTRALYFSMSAVRKRPSTGSIHLLFLIMKEPDCRPWLYAEFLHDCRNAPLDTALM